MELDFVLSFCRFALGEGEVGLIGDLCPLGDLSVMLTSTFLFSLSSFSSCCSFSSSLCR